MNWVKKAVGASGTIVGFGEEAFKFGTKVISKSGIPIISGICSAADFVADRAKDLAYDLRIGTLSSNISLLTQNKSELQEKITELNSDYQSLSQQIESDHFHLEKTSLFLRSLTSQLNSVNQQIDLHSQAISLLQDQTTSLEQKTKDLETIISQEKDNISSLTEKIITFDLQLADLTNRIANIERDNSLHSQKITYLQEEITEIKEKLSPVSSSPLPKKFDFSSSKVFDLWIDPNFSQDILASSRSNYPIKAEVYDYYLTKFGSETMAGFIRSEFQEIKKENSIRENEIFQLTFQSTTINQNSMTNKFFNIRILYFLIIFLFLFSLFFSRIRKLIKKFFKWFIFFSFLTIIFFLSFKQKIFPSNYFSQPNNYSSNNSQSFQSSQVSHSISSTRSLSQWISDNIDPNDNYFTSEGLSFDQYLDKLNKAKNTREKRIIFFDNKSINHHFQQQWQKVSEKESFLSLLNFFSFQTKEDLFLHGLSLHFNSTFPYLADKVKYNLIDFSYQSKLYLTYQGLSNYVQNIDNLLFLFQCNQWNRIYNYFSLEEINKLTNLGLLPKKRRQSCLNS